MSAKPLTLDTYQGRGQTLETRGRSAPLFDTVHSFEEPAGYLADKGLRDAVNVALALGRPLLVTGEPGTGKTQLANSIAYELSLPLLIFYTKTTSCAQDLFYQYDALQRFHDAQMKLPVDDIESYITYQALGQAILLSATEHTALLSEELRAKAPTRAVVLIDEIDKAPRDLPNDILDEVEKMRFTVKETGVTYSAERVYRPILVLTSNSEKQLPDAFLRRCVFYHIEFPLAAQLEEIIQSRFQASDFNPEHLAKITRGALAHFKEIRSDILGLRKKPATAELLDWLHVLLSLELDPGNLEQLRPEQLDSLALSYAILAKSREDVDRLLEHFIEPRRGRE